MSYRDYVHEQFNSKIWPSDDPTDSPINTFTCKLCKWQFAVRVFGEFSIAVDPYDKVKKIIKEHVAEKHRL